MSEDIKTIFYDEKAPLPRFPTVGELFHDGFSIWQVTSVDFVKGIITFREYEDGPYGHSVTQKVFEAISEPLSEIAKKIMEGKTE